MGLADAKHFVLGERGRPSLHGGVGRVHVAAARGHVHEARIIGQRRRVHGAHQLAPVAFADADDGDMAILGLIDVVWRHAQRLVAIARARRIAAKRVVGAEGRGEGGEHGVLHGHVQHGAGAGLRPAIEGRDDGRVQVDAAQDVAQRRARLQGRLAIVAGDADGAAHGLHGDVHRKVVPMRAGGAEAGTGGVNEARIRFGENIAPHPQPRHRAGREVLQQHVTPLGEFDEQIHALRGLEVDGDGLLVAVQHGEGVAGRAIGAPAQALADGRFHLDDAGAGHRQQMAAVRAVVDLAQIEHRDAGQRLCAQAGFSFKLFEVVSETAALPRRRDAR